MRKVLLAAPYAAMSAVALVGHAAAQEEPELDELAEMDLEELLGVVVAASDREESLSVAPAAVSVLDREDIRLSGATTVVELLRTVPGVQVVDSGAGNYVVALRGMGGVYGNNVVVVVDGIPMNSPLDASVDWRVLAVRLDQIERIEVVRGPVSPIYGANAYTGVIRIDTVAPPEEERVTGRVRLAGLADQDLDVGGLLSGEVAGRTGDLAFAVRGHGALDDTESLDGSKSLRGAGIGTSVSWALTENVRLRLGSGFTLHERDYLDYLVQDGERHRSRFGYGELALEVDQLAPFLDSVEIWGRGRWLAVDADEGDAVGFDYDGTRAMDGRTGVTFRHDSIEPLSLAFGAEASVVHVDAPFIHQQENDEARLGYGLFVNATVDVADRLSLGAAARVDESAFVREPQLSLRGSVIYHRPTFSARLSVASAYRQPSYVELASRFREPSSGLILLEGTAGLDVPRVESVEVGVTAAVLEGLTVRPTAYLARARDLVVGDFTRLARKTFRNDEDGAAFAGFELEVDWAPVETVELGLNGSALWFLRDQEDPAATVGAPDHNSQLTLWAGGHGQPVPDRFQVGGGVALLSGRSYAVRAGIPPSLLDREVPTLFRLDAALGYRPLPEQPLWLRVKGLVHLPTEQIESPFLLAEPLGARVLLAAEYLAE